ncbi:CPBP family intramembrane glutamic endopeptidase [Saccharothrix xinjiangensis]|uniref:CPBP family intramembrane glutamic endopeptidase n=1 Tax=Saccharothrix xinjiangensis TaxID=204798 RepID=A0ABV9Y4Q7_9PSEU
MRIRGGTAVLVAGSAVIAGAALYLVLTGRTGVRYSADHDGTVPLWFRWVPVLVGIALVRLVPFDAAPLGEPPRRLRAELAVLTAAAVAFALVLPLVDGDLGYAVVKVALLAAVPVALLWRARWSPARPDRRWVPLAPVAGWLVVAHGTPLAPPAGDPGLDAAALVAALVVGFFANAVLEELFYRRWLQTRWEFALGAWPAIVLSSLLWAVWHVAIQGTGDLPVDLASAVVNQGVLGLFLGCLWSRYRLMWPLLVVHGAVNSAPILLGVLFR